MKYKILHHLQFYYQENVIVVQINEKYLTNRTHIFDVEESAHYFVDVEEILTKDGKLEIVYHRPTGYTPLLDLKEYADFYKLDIVNRLLEMNVLENQHTYLAMQNILLKDTRDLLFIYKADQFGSLPYANKEELEQWKNFICSFFGKFTLEKYEKNRVEVLTKEKNSFLNEVEGTDSLGALTELVKNRLTEEQKNFFSTKVQEERISVRQNRRKKTIRLALVVGAIVLYIGTIFAMKAKERQQIDAVQQSAETEITILNKIIDNDSASIEKDMQKLNYPKKKQVDIYIKLGDYKKAYELDKTADQKIVQSLYKQGETEKIEQLDLSGSDYLSDFKKILTYDDATDIEYLVQTSTDPTVIEAIIDQAVKKNDLPTVKTIRQVSLTQKKLAIDSKRQINMIDLLIENNNEELESIYKDNAVNNELKKKQTNDLLEENNALLSEKIELTNAEKD
ncbi:conjugal transfer protein TraF [Enterococcus italicus]|uniref:conjugal transfer protein TraF n=1 Tax=Enterococcus italicus TaxID=246144 RepID=UPI003F482FB0